MRKLFTMSVLALTLVLVSSQQASAWSNIKFGVGMNFHWQTGDNNLLWGVFRNGQIPGPGPYGPMYGGGHGGGDGFPMYYEQAATQNAKPATTPTQAPANASQTSYNPNPYGYYQPVGYYPNSQYQVPMYTPNYYPYQVPSYWYGQ